MVADSETSLEHPTVEAFIQALAERDFTALEACLAPDVAFRVLLPGGVVEVGSDREAAGVLEHWFGVYDRYRFVSATASKATLTGIGGKLSSRRTVKLSTTDSCG